MTPEVRFVLGVLAIAVSLGVPAAAFAAWVLRQPLDWRGREPKYRDSWEVHYKRQLGIGAAVVLVFLFGWGVSAVTGTP